VIGRIEAAEALDKPSYAIETAIARPARIAGRPSAKIGDTLHGTGYGHPVHPMLVTIPIGTWTLAFALDLLAALGILRNERADRTAEAALKMGAAGAVTAAASGLADWQHTNGRDRRVGMIHAVVNSTALSLNLASIALRGRGHHRQGRLASAVGWLCMFAGGYLGGTWFIAAGLVWTTLIAAQFLAISSLCSPLTGWKRIGRNESRCGTRSCVRLSASY